MKLFITVALVSTLVALGQGQQQVASSVYNCSGKPNGNYNHPTDCTKFISCSNGYTYEMDCPACHLSDGPNRCPAGKLHYYLPGDRCEWADVAQCSVGATSSQPIQSSTEGWYTSTEDTAGTREETTPTSTAEPPTTSQPGNSCNPESCKHEGNCTSYKICNKDTSTWTELKCAEGLFWNPEVNRNKTGGLGGSCDFWVNLSDDTKTAYEEDKVCFPLCYYKATADCSPDYIYHPEDTEHRTIIELTCPKTLIWNQEKETCDLCSKVAGCTVC